MGRRKVVGDKPADERSLESIQDWMKHADFETRVEYWMKRPGYECLAGESGEVTVEILRRILERSIRELLDERRFSLKQLRETLDVLEDACE